MNRVFEAAAELQRFCEFQHNRFCFIGGLAVQRWGEPRVTHAADLTLLTGFASEAEFLTALLENFRPRRPDAAEFALASRILLITASNDVPLDVALAGISFEERSVERATVWTVSESIRLTTQFFGKSLNPAEARAFVASLGEKSIGEPANFEEQALKFLGRELYETFFYGYTKKQWGCEPSELPASILKRLPIRFNYDDNYYNTRFQGIPAEGYSEMVRRILEHERISMRLSTRYEHSDGRKFDHIFHTGPLDAFFEFKLGRLGYRTVTFERIDALGNFQGNAVINYPGMEVSHTRIHEHKHLAPWEKHEATVAFREFSREISPNDVPYYPKRLTGDMQLLRQYAALADQESGVSFLGRLATYRYLNMDQVIGEALDFVKLFRQSLKEQTRPPVFAASLA